MSVNLVNQTDASLAPIAGATIYADEPIGAILPFGGSTVPNGFLLCNGAAVSRTTYAALFAVIGTAFGAGDGSTTFNIPDLRGEFLRGAGTNSHSGQGSGGSVGTHQNATFVPAFYNAGSGTTLVLPGKDTTWNGPDSQTTQTSGYRTLTSAAGGTTNVPLQYSTRPTNTSVNYIIKATTISLPSDFEAAVDEKIDDITSIEYNSATLVSQSNYTFDKCQYTKSGHLCTAFIQLDVITNATSEINCASGFPRSAQDGANAHFWAFRWDNFNVDPVGLYINQNGNLLVKGGISGGSSPYVVAFTYITKD